MVGQLVTEGQQICSFFYIFGRKGEKIKVSYDIVGIMQNFKLMMCVNFLFRELRSLSLPL